MKTINTLLTIAIVAIALTFSSTAQAADYWGWHGSPHYQHYSYGSAYVGPAYGSYYQPYSYGPAYYSSPYSTYYTPPAYGYTYGYAPYGTGIGIGVGVPGATIQVGPGAVRFVR